MEMGGLARGRAPWVTKSAFLCRGASALVLLIAVPGALGTTGITLAGIVAFWIWGVGSAVLGVIGTDMPGEPPTRAGAAHALVARVAHVAGAAGAILLSLEVLGRGDAGGLAVWALALALAAAVAMIAQFAAFGAPAREARAASPSASVTPAATAPAAAPAPAAATAPATALPPLAGIPPQLATAGPARVPPGQAARRRAAGAPVSLHAFAGYAGARLRRAAHGLDVAARAGHRLTSRPSVVRASHSAPYDEGDV
jgi:hypothetical protein